MQILLDNADLDIENRLRGLVSDKDDIEVVNNYLMPFDTKEGLYWHELWLATQGDRYWSENRLNSPMYAGILPKNDDELRRMVVDAKYSQARANLFASFGVNYLGRTFVDPHTVLLIDNKKDNPTLNPELSEEISSVFRSMPDSDWVNGFGIVSTSNVNNLEEFFDYLGETDVLAYSSAAKAKLRFIGRDFAEIDVPEANESYGKMLRETAIRHKNKKR